MSDIDTIKFAVIGCGHIGKRHAEMVCRNKEAELVALVDIKDRALLGIEKYDQPFFTSLDELLKSNIELDVIIISTPNYLHAEQALLSLRTDKHVVVEKPMALSRKDAEKIVFEAEKTKKQVFAVMQNRYSPPSVWIKEVVDRGVLGKIFLVQMHCFWNRDERYYQPDSWHGKKIQDGGTLFTQFSHFIDIMYWLFGDIKNITSRTTNFNHRHCTEFEDSGMANFEFVNGGMGSISFSTSAWDKNFESGMVIIAENGCVKIGGQYMDKVEYCHIKDYQMPELPPTNPGNNYGIYKGSAANHHYVIDNVVDVLKGRGRVKTNAFEGLKVVDIIERIYNGAS